MAKVCTACGFAPEPPEKSENEPEDCPECGGKGTVQHSEEGEGEAGE